MSRRTARSSYAKVLDIDVTVTQHFGTFKNSLWSPAKRRASAFWEAAMNKK